MVLFFLVRWVVLKMVKKNILIFMLVVCFMSFVISVDPIFGTFKKGETIDLIQTCSNCTFNNITSIIFPNGTEVVFNAAMTKDGTVYNFTLSKPDTDTIGLYFVNGVGDLNGDNRVWRFDFQITKNGFALSEAESRVYLLLFISFLLLLCLSLTVAILTPFSNIESRSKNELSIIKVTLTKYVKIGAIWFTYGLYLALLTLLTGLTQNYVNFPELKRLMTNIYTYSYFLGYGFTMLILSLVFILVWKDIIFSKEIRKSGKAFIGEITR